MPDLQPLYQRAAIIRDAVLKWENTANRVGSLFYDIITQIKTIESSYFLRKDSPDIAAELITFQKGIKIGEALFTWDAESGSLKISESLYSLKEVSAYGAGSGSGTGGTVGSLGGLANVGLWADDVPASDRIMVQLAGATHWSSKLLSEIVGLDTVALGAYLVANSYAKQSYVDARVAELVGTAPATLDTLNELAAALGNDPNFATSMSTLIGTKWTQDNTKIANWDSAFSNIHSHANKSVIDLLTQDHLNILSHLSIVEGRIKVDTDLWSTGELSAYGAGTDTGGGSMGSLGGLVNVGSWADEVPVADKVMVRMAGSTHWSGKLLSEIVGLDTSALSTYLSTNKYTTETYVNTKIYELVGTSPTTLDTLNELAAALGNDPNFATSISTLIGTKWTQDNAKIGNWDSAYSHISDSVKHITGTERTNWNSAYSALHSHTNKTVLDGVTSELITNWNTAFTNNHTHSNKAIIDSITQANLDVLAKLSIVDGNLKVDTNLWSTGEVSAYGAGSGTGGGSGLISSVLGSAGLGGSYLDSDYTNTFNAYTINLINNNLTSALGRIGALETSTPNVAWGTATSQYSPLTINSVTRNLSVEGHTHNYLPLSGGMISGILGTNTLSLSSDFGDVQADGAPWYGIKNFFGQYFKISGYFGLVFKTATSDLAMPLGGDLTYNTYKVWHSGNDGSGSGLDADLLDGVQLSTIRQSNIYPLGYYYGEGTTVENCKQWIVDRFNSATSNGIGANVTISSSYIDQWDNNAGAYYPSSVYSMIKISGGYEDMLYGQFLLSSYDLTNIGVVGRTGNNWTSTKWLAFTTDNVASSSKLQTSRTIWGQSFNGEADVNGTVFTNIGVKSRNICIETDNLGNASTLSSEINNFNSHLFLQQSTANNTIICCGGGNVGIGTNSPSFKLDVNGTFRSTESGYINGNLYVGSASVDKTILTRIISSHDSGLLALNPWGGNVVIGAPNAIEKLYVNGSTKINGYFRVSNDCISAGEYENNGYGFINVCRTASIENASYFSMVRASTAAFGIGLSTDNSIIIGGAAPDKTINNIHLKLHSDYVTTSKALSSSNRIYSGYDSGINNSISCSNWFRSSGESGWYSDTYGGGIYMTDSTYVKVYGSKSFWVNGNVVATGEVTAYSASDVRLKSDIQPLSNSLCLIEQMNPVSYTWNDMAKSLNPYKGDGRDFGLIAQELECVMPELVHTIYGGQYKSIDYIKIIPHLIVAIKQLKMEIDNLRSNIINI